MKRTTSARYDSADYLKSEGRFSLILKNAFPRMTLRSLRMRSALQLVREE